MSKISRRSVMKRGSAAALAGVALPAVLSLKAEAALTGDETRLSDIEFPGDAPLKDGAFDTHPDVTVYGFSRNIQKVSPLQLFKDAHRQPGFTNTHRVSLSTITLPPGDIEIDEPLPWTMGIKYQGQGMHFGGTTLRPSDSFSGAACFLAPDTPRRKKKGIYTFADGTQITIRDKFLHGSKIENLTINGFPNDGIAVRGCFGEGTWINFVRIVHCGGYGLRIEKELSRTMDSTPMTLGSINFRFNNVGLGLQRGRTSHTIQMLSGDNNTVALMEVFDGGGGGRGGITVYGCKSERTKDNKQGIVFLIHNMAGVFQVVDSHHLVTRNTAEGEAIFKIDGQETPVSIGGLGVHSLRRPHFANGLVSPTLTVSVDDLVNNPLTVWA